MWPLSGRCALYVWYSGQGEVSRLTKLVAPGELSQKYEDTFNEFLALLFFPDHDYSISISGLGCGSIIFDVAGFILSGCRPARY